MTEDGCQDRLVSGAGGLVCGGGWFFRQNAVPAGTFAAASRVGADEPPMGPSFIGTGDLNGDTFLDVAAGGTLAYQNPAMVGSFVTQPALMGAGLGVFDIVDLDEDQRLDLAGTSAERAVVFFQTATDGSFGPAVPFGPADVRAVAAADVDGDGLEDLVVGGTMKMTLLTQVAGSPGTFEQAATADWGTSLSVEVVDLNGDGRPDLYQSIAGGTYLLQCGEPQPRGEFSGSHTIVGGSQLAFVADVNADGYVDSVAPVGAGGVELRLQTPP